MFLDTLGAKTPKLPMFLAPWKPKTTIFTVFFVLPLLAKNHGIYNVFLPGPSKNIGIYVVFSMWQEDVFSCQRHKKHCKITVKNGKQSPKSVQNGPPKRILEF